MPLCLYTIDPVQGGVWRSRLDGSQRELVVGAGALNSSRRIGLQTPQPTTGQKAKLMLTDIPYGGFTLLDAAPSDYHRAFLEKQLNVDRVLFLDSLKQSTWKLETLQERQPIPPGWKGGKLVRIGYRFSSKRLRRTYKGTGSVLGLLSTDQAVLLSSGGQVLLWDLQKDKKSAIASARDAVVWPRDLRNTARFRPVAETRITNPGSSGIKPGIYAWRLRNPSDIRPLRQYLKRAFGR